MRCERVLRRLGTPGSERLEWWELTRVRPQDDADSAPVLSLCARSGRCITGAGPGETVCHECDVKAGSIQYITVYACNCME